MTRGITAAAVLVLQAAGTLSVGAVTDENVQARLSRDFAAEQPAVIHVVVALCDNQYQGIAPVPEQLGNGQDPRSNLYWGALYGVRTHLSRHGWQRETASMPEDEGLLERIVFFRTMPRSGVDVSVYVVADAWDGRYIKAALGRFLDMSGGRAREKLRMTRTDGDIVLNAGGLAHLLVYVGHNGLMDFSLPTSAPAPEDAEARSSIVLACASKEYFLDHLRSADAHPLLLTTGLMAPEAYTLDAAIRSFISGGSSGKVREAAADAYDKYQHCGIGAAHRLFWGAP